MTKPPDFTDLKTQKKPDLKCECVPQLLLVTNKYSISHCWCPPSILVSFKGKGAVLDVSAVASKNVKLLNILRQWKLGAAE